MKNIPKFIFLQMGLEEENSVEDFNSLHSDCVTWETEQIYSDDLKFISVDSILARIKELEDDYISEPTTFIRAYIRVEINALKNLLK